MIGGEGFKWRGEAHDPKHNTSSVIHGGGSVMAWASGFNAKFKRYDFYSPIDLIQVTVHNVKLDDT